MLDEEDEELDDELELLELEELELELELEELLEELEDDELDSPGLSVVPPHAAKLPANIAAHKTLILFIIRTFICFWVILLRVVTVRNFTF